MLELLTNFAGDLAGKAACRVEKAAQRTFARAALAGTSIASGNAFWLQAALGRNQLKMHECSKGAIRIGGVSEQLYGEGFVRAFHDVLREQVGGDEEKLRLLLEEMGARGARWEIEEAIARGVWVPWFLKGYAGKPELLARARQSRVFGPLVRETLGIVLRMVMTEGGWGEIRSLDIASEPAVVTVANSPETRGKNARGCYLMTGIYRGYFRHIFGKECEAKETTCVSRGDRLCTFEVSFALLPETHAAPAAASCATTGGSCATGGCGRPPMAAAETAPSARRLPLVRS
jgi:hypothetical protein